MRRTHARLSLERAGLSSWQSLFTNTGSARAYLLARLRLTGLQRNERYTKSLVASGVISPSASNQQEMEQEIYH